MNFRFTVLETSLNRAEFRWKWVRFVKFSSVLGVCLGLLLLLLGASIRLEWITTTSRALMLFGVLCVVGLFAWLVGTIAVLASSPNRPWLAAVLERVDPRFLDRLNTLLFLEGSRHDFRAHSFAVRIARQIQTVLNQKPSPPAFSSRRSWTWFGALIAAVLGLVVLNNHFEPWLYLKQLQAARPAAENPAGKTLELPMPTTNNVEQSKTWGEVRITDPGTDLRVTKVDVVPLQIEAAANERLQGVEWFTAINGGAESPHQLPPPNEPRYAVFQPEIYLDEMKLADWDVLTYYAHANTERSNAYASDVYFLEVRPFREDIAKLPGGEGGKAYKCLSELSGLITRQQHVVRETHQHVKNPPELENLRAQDRKKLGDAEIDLSKSTRHFYAEMATEMENKPIGEALDNLAKAERSLDTAGGQIHSNSLPEAQKTERSALSELIAARKMFQKAVSDNPDAFKEEQTPEDEPVRVADHLRKLGQMAEFRDEAKAAKEFVQKTYEEQRHIEERTRSAPLSQYPRLAEEQEKLRQQLKDFAAQHPAPFKGSETEAKDSQQAMQGAAKSLEARRTEARNATKEARNQLEKLAGSMQDQSLDRQLADAYRLKRMLDQQARKLDEHSRSQPSLSDAELRQTGREATQTVNQLRKVAEEEPTRDAFGQPLRDALYGQNKVELDGKLQRLQLALDDAASRQAAGEAADALKKVSDAFSASQPNPLQMARQNDSLKPKEQDRFSQGMAELESLVRQLQKDAQLSKQDQAKQCQQALVDLQGGMRSQYGGNERGVELLARLEKLLKAQEGLDPGDLKKLLEEIQHFALETSEQLARKDDEPQVTNIDPANLPPAYRSRIQKYFQKLSEK